MEPATCMRRAHPAWLPSPPRRTTDPVAGRGPAAPTLSKITPRRWAAPSHASAPPPTANALCASSAASSDLIASRAAGRSARRRAAST